MGSAMCVCKNCQRHLSRRSTEETHPTQSCPSWFYRHVLKDRRGCASQVRCVDSLHTCSHSAALSGWAEIILVRSPWGDHPARLTRLCKWVLDGGDTALLPDAVRTLLYPAKPLTHHGEPHHVKTCGYDTTCKICSFEASAGRSPP